ncbi:MAG: SusC/RagA family TonB-linked outer membrane protein [Bacteroidetes bacterium]|nr:MAG: SusC/RagA family TonB-linked outer membrane protein [Bacteroidota bacterium]
MKRLKLFLAFLFSIGMFVVHAQTTVTGTVTDKNGAPIPGASIAVKGTAVGTITDANGSFSVNAPEDATTLIFSFMGMKTHEFPISEVVNVILEDLDIMVDDVVVTALGISREKKALGYAVQELDGDELSNVKSDNFVNSLSGKVSGVQVKRTTNMGGSTNILIRGNSSLTGNNQALFVIDGVPVSNANTNSRDQEQAGGSAYDYGNAASDINPEDIESISVLKGAAASALYGSRAANGVIMITTKKGSKDTKGIGITFSSGLTVSQVDKSTFPTYQTEYGAGYGPYYDDPSEFFWYEDINGDGTDDLVTPMTEDASYGGRYDPNLMVYQWNAFDLESPKYMQATPWVNAENGPITFFETPILWSNTLSIDNAFDRGSYRLSYTNTNQGGLLPNSELKKNNFSMSLNYKVTEKLTASASANYIDANTKGRNITGYGDNIMGMFRQWWQTNVDVQELKDAYFTTKRNVTWNNNATDDLTPIYWDNSYWTRYENYQSDNRGRIIGNMSLNYKLFDWLDVLGRVSVDSYSEVQEERRQVGSVAAEFGIGEGFDGSLRRSDQQSGYQRKEIRFSEYNYDLMFNYNYSFSEKVNIAGVVGTNIRRSNYDWLLTATNGGIGVEGLYSIQNSVNPVPFPKESAQKIGVDGIYGSFSFGYNHFLFLDATIRRDHSSTLPADNSIYYYPSVAASFVFDKFVPGDLLSHGKLRMSYAQVGNSAGFDQINDTYNIAMPLNAAMTSVDDNKKNPELKPEITTSIETGLELNFLHNRLRFDLAYYKMNTVDQILPVKVTAATGYYFKVINAGEIENKGFEIMLSATPIKVSDFSWDITLNWAKNNNKVVSLTEGLDNLQLGTFQQGITLNAMPGEPYGVIYGTDYTYHENGERLVDPTNGQYLPTSTSDNVIGNPNPDWNGGLNNAFRYKNLTFSFLIDVQKGGDIWSLDMAYGLGTGMYEETAYINDLGNPVRNSLADGGGFINEGVNPDGSINTTRINAARYGAFGYRRGLPNSAFLYDASYVKLREVVLSYTLPAKLFSNNFISGASLSFVGSNLWIIHKNLPHADPESGLGAGNLQGYSVGSLPSTRNFGFNIKLHF